MSDARHRSDAAAAQRVFAEALEQGVFLYIQDHQLKYRARPGALSPDLRERLNQHRDEIVTRLERLAVAGASAIQPPPVRRRVGDSPVPLSFAQRRMWFIDQLGSGSSQYQGQHAFLLRGALDVAALQRAFDSMCRRHEVLRTIVREDNDQPYQVVLEDFDAGPAIVDLSDRDAAQRDLEVRRLIAEDRLRPIRLDRDLMFRATLITLEPQAHVLVLNVHHIAGDGWETEGSR